MGNLPTRSGNGAAADAPTTKKIAPRDAIFHELGVRASVIASMLGGDEQLAEAFRRSAVAHFVDALNSSDKDRERIASVNVPSYIGACMEAAMEGLTPDGEDGWILIRKGGIATWTRSYRGATKLAHRAADIRGLVSEVVYRQEIALGGFRCDHAMQTISHSPWFMFPDDIADEPDENQIVLVYAACEVKIAGEWKRHYRVLTARALDQRARMSGNPYDDMPSNVWVKWYREQARAKAIGALVDMLPKPDHAWQAIQASRKLGHVRQLPDPMTTPIASVPGLADRVRALSAAGDSSTAREDDDPNDPHGAIATEAREAAERAAAEGEG